MTTTSFDSEESRDSNVQRSGFSGKVKEKMYARDIRVVYCDGDYTHGMGRDEDFSKIDLKELSLYIRNPDRRNGPKTFGYILDPRWLNPYRPSRERAERYGFRTAQEWQKSYPRQPTVVFDIDCHIVGDKGNKNIDGRDAGYRDILKSIVCQFPSVLFCAKSSSSGVWGILYADTCADTEKNEVGTKALDTLRRFIECRSTENRDAIRFMRADEVTVGDGSGGQKKVPMILPTDEIQWEIDYASLRHDQRGAGGYDESPYVNENPVLFHVATYEEKREAYRNSVPYRLAKNLALPCRNYTVPENLARSAAQAYTFCLPSLVGDYRVSNGTVTDVPLNMCFWVVQGSSNGKSEMATVIQEAVGRLGLSVRCSGVSTGEALTKEVKNAVMDEVKGVAALREYRDRIPVLFRMDEAGTQLTHKLARKEYDRLLLAMRCFVDGRITEDSTCSTTSRCLQTMEVNGSYVLTSTRNPNMDFTIEGGDSNGNVRRFFYLDNTDLASTDEEQATLSRNIRAGFIVDAVKGFSGIGPDRNGFSDAEDMEWFENLRTDIERVQKMEFRLDNEAQMVMYASVEIGGNTIFTDRRHAYEHVLRIAAACAVFRGEREGKVKAVDVLVGLWILEMENRSRGILRGIASDAMGEDRPIVECLKAIGKALPLTGEQVKGKLKRKLFGKQRFTLAMVKPYLIERQYPEGKKPANAKDIEFVGVLPEDKWPEDEEENGRNADVSYASGAEAKGWNGRCSNGTVGGRKMSKEERLDKWAESARDNLVSEMKGIQEGSRHNECFNKCISMKGAGLGAGWSDSKIRGACQDIADASVGAGDKPSERKDRFYVVESVMKTNVAPRYPKDFNSDTIRSDRSATDRSADFDVLNDSDEKACEEAKKIASRIDSYTDIDEIVDYVQFVAGIVPTHEQTELLSKMIVIKKSVTDADIAEVIPDMKETDDFIATVRG